MSWFRQIVQTSFPHKHDLSLIAAYDLDREYKQIRNDHWLNGDDAEVGNNIGVLIYVHNLC